MKIPKYEIFTSTAGSRSAFTLKLAREIAADLRRSIAVEGDSVRIFRFLKTCSPGCTCAGQIHPQSVEIK